MSVAAGSGLSDMLRQANNLIWESLRANGYRESVAFFCECSDPGCYRPVWLTLEEYETARRDPRWQALAIDS